MKNGGFKIEKGIPPPAQRAKYPFKQMEIGDSVFIAEVTTHTITGSFAALRPKKFTCRAKDGGVRIWRVQ